MTELETLSYLLQMMGAAMILGIVWALLFSWARF